MATVKAPLLSLDARGQLGKALVYLGWKGLKTVRQHVVPANPKTDAQKTQRAYVTTLVAAFKNFFTDTENRAAWDRWALNHAKAMSGFNGFMSQALKLLPDDPNVSMVSSLTETAGDAVTFATLNVDDGTTGNETGDFEIWAGTTISNMVLSEEVAIVTGDIVGTQKLGDAGDTIYCKVRLLGYDRSGIFAATLID